ncbi:MAG: hypothetical protein VKK04_04140 [Synechococcales bacterium]|nr:hypothetical protein [Synechococcales bacterium]
MQVGNLNWTSQEKEIAQKAFETAYQRETTALIEAIRSQASQVTELEDIWQLHDFLSARRHDLDGKYDNRYGMLVFVFANLVKEGWLTHHELEGLDNDKLAKIKSLSRM